MYTSSDIIGGLSDIAVAAFNIKYGHLISKMGR